MTDLLENIQHRITVDAPISRVWEALLDPGKVVQWLGCLQFQPQIGHVFYMQPDNNKRKSGSIVGATHCEVLAIEKEDKVVFSWFRPGMPKTTVTISLTEQSSELTEVRLTHDGWSQYSRDVVAQIRQALNSGWGFGVLPQLKNVAEE